MKKNIINKILSTKFFVILVICMLLSCGVFVGVKTVFETKSGLKKLGFEDIGELVTQSAYATNMKMLDKSKEVFGISIPFTQTKYIYSYDFIIKAGVNFSEIEYKVDEEKKLISVKIPEVKVLSNEIQLDSFKVYHEEESMFTPISLSQNNFSMLELQNEAEKTAVNNGLLKNAEENAEIILKSFFAQKYNLNEYSIQFTKYKDN